MRKLGSSIYVSLPKWMFAGAIAVGAVLFIAGSVAFFTHHPHARRLVWPAPPVPQQAL